MLPNARAAAAEFKAPTTKSVRVRYTTTSLPVEYSTQVIVESPLGCEPSGVLEITLSVVIPVLAVRLLVPTG